VAFGEIPGQPIGALYPDRMSLSKAGVHRHTQAGISGGAKEGAESIVLHGGYEDDVDLGAELIYTGEGGRDINTGRQIADQQLIRGNAGLVKSCTENVPVRVIRGFKGDRRFSPASGYRYDGLFYVTDFWFEKGRAGFKICRFRLVQIPAEGLPIADDKELATVRRLVSSSKIVRNIELARKVKELHGYACQICGIVLSTPSGLYAESAHIKPLGRPHDGPDTISNIVCLCPNDHVRFDCLAVFISDDLRVIDAVTKADVGQLTEHRQHRIERNYLAYHRQMCGVD
jgi:putative restriction endonuclease